MLSKKEIKDIQSLGHKKSRDALKLFVAEGPKIVGELLELIPDQLERIYATKEWDSGLYQGAPELTEITDTELERISQLQTPHQVVAVFRYFEESPAASGGFRLYLDTIQDPGNFGTIIRIADWFGVDQIICSAGCADRYNPKVIQASMASIARVPVRYEEDPSWLQQQQTTVYAATLDGTSLYEQPRTEEGILLIGNESKGIRPELLQQASIRLTIPRRGGAESLNAAVATGIILSHLLN